MRIFKNIVLFSITSIMLITSINAKSYISNEYVSIDESVMFNSEEFEIYLELKSLSYAVSDELGMLSGYTKRVNEDIYYYHYVFYFYDTAYKEIGSADGYSGMWHDTSISGTGTFLGQVISSENIYNGYSVNSVKYYKLFIERVSKNIVEDYLYKGIKKNTNGIDEILDIDTTLMKVNTVKTSLSNNPNSYIDSSTDEPIVSNYSLEINVSNNKRFKVKEFVRISNKKQGGVISKTIYKNSEIFPENIKSIDNFINEGNVTEKSYKNFNQIIINEETSSFEYDITFEKDKNKEEDIIRYVISGDLDISVEKISFKINLPYEFESSSMKLLNANGKELNQDNYTYKIDENSILINYLVKVYPSEKVIFELCLPNNYFDNNKVLDLTIVIIILGIISIFLSIVILILNKRKKGVNKCTL